MCCKHNPKDYTPLKSVISKNDQLVFHRTVTQEVDRLLYITDINPVTDCLYVDYQVRNVLSEEKQATKITAQQQLVCTPSKSHA